MVPHLSTALTGPINELEQRILESMPAIERWFRLEWMEHTPAFYSSVDLRNAGFKLAPVDTNLFPSGFHNLTDAMLPLAVQAAMAAIEKICPEAKNLLLVPEQRAVRNSFYLTHLQRLMQVFTQAGLHVRLGGLDPGQQGPLDLPLPDGGTLRLEPLVRGRGRVGLKDFDPCTILLNDDLSAGTPKILQDLHQQYLLPPLHAGWGVRRKSRHFQSYEEVAKKFAKLLGMDPWLINPLHARCDGVDFQRPEGLADLQAQVDALLGKVRRKYKEYGINERPFVVVKADNGTQGRGILTLRDARELESLPERVRQHMAQPQDGVPLSEVLLQEGVATFERINEAVAEPVVCMIDRYVVGGYYRIHAELGPDENLNAPGSSYVPLAFAEQHQLPRAGAKPGASAPNRFYMYGVIGRLAMLAAAYELEATDPEAESYD
jgi:glutamate--cysteine ligase